MSSTSILLLASKTGYQTRVFAGAAANLGFSLVLATDRCHQLEDPWGDHAIAVRFEDPEAAAEELARRFPDIAGVFAVGDRPSSIAARVALKLRLPYHPVEAVERCRDKHAFRETIGSRGLPVPSHYLHSLDDPPIAARWYPCVLKPRGLSASRGVIRANNGDEFLTAFARIKSILNSPEIREHRDPNDRSIHVEQFIPGREFALEGIVENGMLHVFTVFDKPDPLNGPYFEETLYVQPARIEPWERAAIIEATQSALEAVGLQRGPLHAEMRVNDKGVWMLELAARPIGGLCARSLRFADGSPLEEVLLRHAAGQDLRGIELDEQASGVMMIPIPKGGLFRGVQGLEQARKTRGVQSIEITAKEGQRFLRLPEGNSYLGFIFARGKSGDEVEHSLRAAHSKLRFDLATELAVVASG